MEQPAWVKWSAYGTLICERCGVVQNVSGGGHLAFYGAHALCQEVDRVGAYNRRERLASIILAALLSSQDRAALIGAFQERLHEANITLAIYYADGLIRALGPEPDKLKS